jgi:predicted RNA-binding Zn-ribbon protein involved in translation (DUF1610 family)
VANPTPYLAKQADQAPIEGHSSQVRCASCGATVLLEDKVVTDRCPFCGTEMTNTPQAAQTSITPESLLPFAISHAQAVTAFNQWIAALGVMILIVVIVILWMSNR